MPNDSDPVLPETQPLGPATQPEPTPAPLSPGERTPGKCRRLIGWLLMRDALARAREDDAKCPPGRKGALKMARAHADVADGLLDSGDKVALAPDCRSLRVEPWTDPLAEVALEPHGSQVCSVTLAWERTNKQWQLIRAGVADGLLSRAVFCASCAGRRPHDPPSPPPGHARAPGTP